MALMRIIASTFLLLASATLSAQSLCRTDEVIYFSCKIKGSSKTVSLCGNDLWDPSTRQIKEDAWLQYRFGTAKRLELLYPNNKTGSVYKSDGEYHHPYQAYSLSVGFTNHGIRYDLNWIEAESSFFGIWIGDGTNVLHELTCKGKPQTSSSDVGPSFWDLTLALDRNRE